MTASMAASEFTDDIPSAIRNKKVIRALADYYHGEETGIEEKRKIIYVSSIRVSLLF